MSRSVIFRRPSGSLVDERIFGEEFVVPVPFELPKIEELPFGTKQQYVVRPDGQPDTIKHPHEQIGWTVEYQSGEQCDWVDVWIVPLIKMPRTRHAPPTLHPSATVDVVPALNLTLQEAFYVAKERNDLHTLVRKRGTKIGIVRLRHQHSGNVIYADIVP
jgi:hypothetical protein